MATRHAKLGPAKRPPPVRARKPHPTTAQLKSAINSGATRDKVAAHDPAMSPLGTDAEAGGASPTPAETIMAMNHEVVEPMPTEAQKPGLSAAFLYGAVIALAAGALLAFVLR